MKQPVARYRCRRLAALGHRAVAGPVSPLSPRPPPTDIDTRADRHDDSAAQAKPNIMLLMDTSDSMARTHMPDEVESVAGTRPSIGYKNSKCNVLYYDPATRCTRSRRTRTASFFPTPNFTGAPYTGYRHQAAVADGASGVD